MLVKISDIAVVKRQRKDMDKKKLLELVNSIKEVGRLIHPINIRPTRPDDLDDAGEPVAQPWMLLTGGRRLAAHLLMGKEEIEASDFRDLNPLEQQIVELEENLRRQDLSWYEEADALARIHQLRQGADPFHTLEKTAEETGVTTPTVHRALKLVEAVKQDPTLKEHTSGASALRKIQHREEIKRREASIEIAQRVDLSKRIVCADARDFVRTIPSQSIDLVFTDLPYGIDYDQTRKDAENMKGLYDDSRETVLDFITDVIPQVMRVVKPGGWIALFMSFENYAFLEGLVNNACAEHADYRDWGFDEFGRPETLVPTCGKSKFDQNPCRFLTAEMPPWIWTRRGKGNFGHYPELHAANRYEMLLVANGGSAKLVKKPVENVLDFAPFSGERLHEMQKPHDLAKEIVSRLTVVGETVLDLCCGSGAHLAAAADSGRNFLGCDSNPENIRSAHVLVSQHLRNKHLAEAPTVAGVGDGGSAIADEDSEALLDALGE